MRILLDHCVPTGFKPLLLHHQVSTTIEMGWESLTNGRLLAEAAKQFDVMLTVDRNLKHQQNLSTLPIAVLVMVVRANTLKQLKPLVPAVESALAGLVRNQLVELPG